MKPHWIIAAVVLAAVAGWAIFASRNQAPDPLYARDRLVNGDAVAVTFKADITDEAFEFIDLKDKGWVWKRTSPNPAGLDGTLIYNGKDYLLEVTDQCFIPLDGVDLPFLPGINSTPKIESVGDIDHNPDGSYSYRVPALQLISYAQPKATVNVTEHLTELEQRPGYDVVIDGDTPSIWYGSYRFATPTKAEQQEAAALIARAKPSTIATITIRERLIWANLTSILQGPFSIVYATDCPGNPIQLRPASQGGQSGGARATVPDFSFAGGLKVAEGILLPVPIAAPQEDLLGATVGEEYGQIAVPVGSVFAIPNNGATMAISISSCRAGPAFPC
jgi:hypothetical protein